MIPILYGSQTGASQYVCKLISCAIEYGFNADTYYDIEKRFQSDGVCKKSFMLEMDEFNVEKLLDVRFIIFVCSTHGDGNEPFNMSRFWRFLKKPELPKGLLSHLKFAIFGMGDTSYDKYNYCSKRLFNRLKSLGAKDIIHRGDGDRQDLSGYLGGFLSWLSLLFDGEHVLEDSSVTLSDCINHTPRCEATLIRSQRLTPLDHSQHINEMVFEIPEYKEFYPGDCIGVKPKNWNYREFLNFNDLKEDSMVEIGDYRGMSYGEIVESHLDYNTSPQHPFFTDLYYLYKDKEIKEEILSKIRELSRDYDLFYDYVTRPKRTVFEILQDLKVTLPMDFMVRFLPQIYARYYSITRIDMLFHITAAIVNFKTILREPRRSICSEYLKRLAPGDKLWLKVAKSSLYFNSDKVLFICTGVGISVARASINYFSDKKFIVFYGFRHRDKDFLYQDELKRKNVKLFTAASRQDGNYIQEIYRNNIVMNIEDYLVIVSGDTRLTREVRFLFDSVYKENVHFQAETW